MLRSRDRKRHAEGFTLIEIAIVLVIIGVLVGMGAGLMGPITKRTKFTQTRDIVKEVYDAVNGYAIANKSLPASLALLSIGTKDSYAKDLLYYPAGGITGSDLCTNQGTYLTVNDKGIAKTNVAFIVFSQGENVCNQTGTASPFTINDQGVVVSCPQDANAGYDDIVKYQDINFLREKICNTFRIVTDSLPTNVEEVAYSSTTLQATDGTTPYSWSIGGTAQGTNGCVGTDYPISGSITGICMTTGGVVSGTAIIDGVYSFTVNVTDAESRSASKSLSITINPNNPHITTLFLHKGTVGIAYNATLSVSGGKTPYTWSLTAGALPPGFSPLNPSGQISGTPTTSGTYSFTVQVTDFRGRTDLKSLSITVEDAGGGGGSGGSGGSGGGAGGGSNLLWIGQQGGNLQSCDATGVCTNHGDKGDHIYAMTVYSAAIWLGHRNGDLKSCNSVGLCTEHGDQGNNMNAMANYSSKVWLGHNGGILQSCDSDGQCTDHGSKGGSNILSMAVFDNKLWIGQSNDHLQSCIASGQCTDYGDKGRDIYSMSEFAGKLWIGQNRGVLKSCDNAGQCTDHGDKGEHIDKMAVFDNKLWIGHRQGELQSCDSNGLCSSHGNLGTDIRAMVSYNSELWVGLSNGALLACDTAGSCTNHGDKGNAIRAIVVY